MLRKIAIENIALIEELTVPFGAGFSALTGETGAGKSILVDAMNLALGERADRELIRTGADKARVEAEFDVSDNARATALLAQWGIRPTDGRIAVSRELSASGRSAVKIGGAAQPLSALRQLTSLLVDLHGQHEHQSLLDEGRHIDILDAYAGEAIAPLASAARDCYAQYAKSRRELASLSGDARERAHRLDMLSFQIREIDQARLKEGEEEELRAHRDKLRNKEAIASAIASAHALLAGSERSRGAADALKMAASQMRSIEEYAEDYAQLAVRIEEAAYAMEDAAMEIGALSEEEDADPRRADAIEQRLDDIRALKRKYGDDIPGILAYRDEAEEELDRLNHGEEWAKQLEENIAQLRVKLLAACEALSAARAQAAERYGAEVLAQLSDLGMGKAKFIIEVEPPEEGFEDGHFSASGYDRVRFLFSANAGEPVKPLSRIASGGEMSRTMLALKSVSAGEVGCLIFDEIDTGISGRMAQAVGEKIARIARGRQIICVTHLPQIACMADEQYAVYKTEQCGRAETRVEKLDREGRVAEIARLVGGADGEAAAHEHAEGMLRAAAARKKEI